MMIELRFKKQKNKRVQHIKRLKLQIIYKYNGQHDNSTLFLHVVRYPFM